MHTMHEKESYLLSRFWSARQIFSVEGGRSKLNRQLRQINSAVIVSLNNNSAQSGSPRSARKVAAEEPAAKPARHSGKYLI